MKASVSVVLAAIILAASGAAMAQEPKLGAAPADQQAPIPAAPAPAVGAAPEEPGMLGAVGRFIDQSISGVTSGLKGAHESIGQATNRAQDAAKGAVDDAAAVVGRLPVPPIPTINRVVSGREICQAAPNGAPDCRAAAEVLCRSKGFSSGASLDMTSAQKCPAQVWLSGREPSEKECTDETFITRAVCQ